MDAVEFNKEFSRFCSNHVCSKCPIRTSQNFTCTIQSRGDNAESVVELVEGWAKEHPIKTRQSEFLNDFPRTFLQDGVVNICPKAVDSAYKPESGCVSTTCCECRNDYWMTEVTL